MKNIRIDCFKIYFGEIVTMKKLFSTLLLITIFFLHFSDSLFTRVSVSFV